MLTAVQGVYRRGRVELVKAPMQSSLRQTLVLVTFLEPSSIDLQVQGIGEAASCRSPSRAWQPSSRTGQAPKWMSMTTVHVAKPAYTAVISSSSYFLTPICAQVSFARLLSFRPTTCKQVCRK